MILYSGKFWRIQVLLMIMIIQFYAETHLALGTIVLLLCIVNVH